MLEKLNKSFFTYFDRPPTSLGQRPEGFYPSGEQLQTILANMSVPQHGQLGSLLSSVEFPHHTPPRITSDVSANSTDARASTSQPTKESDSLPPDERRSSSIAALRLKAREHEIQLDKLRQTKQNDNSP